MVEPTYTYVRGQGWVPESPELVVICGRRVSIPDDLYVQHKEGFLDFLKHITPFARVSSLRDKCFKLCSSNCQECDDTFRIYANKLVEAIYRVAPDIDLLTAARDLWQCE